MQLRRDGIPVELHVHGILPTAMVAERERLRQNGVVLDVTEPMQTPAYNCATPVLAAHRYHS